MQSEDTTTMLASLVEPSGLQTPVLQLAAGELREEESQPQMSIEDYQRCQLSKFDSAL